MNDSIDCEIFDKEYFQVRNSKKEYEDTEKITYSCKFKGDKEFAENYLTVEYGKKVELRIE